MKSKIITSVRLSGSGHEYQKNNFTLMSKKSIVLCLLAFPLFYACKEEKKEHTPFETADIIPIKTATVQSLAHAPARCADPQSC